MSWPPPTEPPRVGLFLQVDGGPDVPAEVELLYRLDTAIMLAVVFLSEAPDPVAAARQVARVSELCAALS